MNDEMKQTEQFAVNLACGHPNKNAGELCELCGQTVPGVAATAQEGQAQPTSPESNV